MDTNCFIDDNSIKMIDKTINLIETIKNIESINDIHTLDNAKKMIENKIEKHIEEYNEKYKKYLEIKDTIIKKIESLCDHIWVIDSGNTNEHTQFICNKCDAYKY